MRVRDNLRQRGCTVIFATRVQRVLNLVFGAVDPIYCLAHERYGSELVLLVVG